MQPSALPVQLQLQPVGAARAPHEHPDRRGARGAEPANEEREGERGGERERGPEEERRAPLGLQRRGGERRRRLGAEAPAARRVELL